MHAGRSAETLLCMKVSLRMRQPFVSPTEAQTSFSPNCLCKNCQSSSKRVYTNFYLYNSGAAMGRSHQPSRAPVTRFQMALQAAAGPGYQLMYISVNYLATKTRTHCVLWQQLAPALLSMLACKKSGHQREASNFCFCHASLNLPKACSLVFTALPVRNLDITERPPTSPSAMPHSITKACSLLFTALQTLPGCF